MIFEISRILGFGALAFIITILWTPALTHFLYKYKLGKQIRTEGAPVFTSLHKKKEGTPTMGGVLVWLTTLIFTVAIWAISKLFSENEKIAALNFLSRKETLLPLGALVASALVGLVDDLAGVFRIGPKGGGLKMRHRLFIYTLIAGFGAWWFYSKLDWDSITIPLLGDYSLGLFYVPLFIFILVATSFSTNETDGLDGLAGGIMMIAFGAMGAISFHQGKYDLAAFCGVISGSLLAFLWFNIHPARFIMGDTGSMSLGTTLGIIAMLTNSFLLLPLIYFIPLIESLSVIFQISSKKIFKKKIFISTPIHHHFEAIGWPETKITERFWIINSVTAIIGLILALFGL